MVALENFDRPFDGRMENYTMSGQYANISSQGRVDPERLLGSWRAVSGLKQNVRAGELPENRQNVVSYFDTIAAEQCVGLCTGVWYRLYRSPSGVVFIEVGRVLGNDQRQVGRVALSPDKEVQSAELVVEKKRTDTASA